MKLFLMAMIKYHFVLTVISFSEMKLLFIVVSFMQINESLSGSVSNRLAKIELNSSSTNFVFENVTSFIPNELFYF